MDMKSISYLFISFFIKQLEKIQNDQQNDEKIMNAIRKVLKRTFRCYQNYKQLIQKKELEASNKQDSVHKLHRYYQDLIQMQSFSIQRQIFQHFNNLEARDQFQHQLFFGDRSNSKDSNTILQIQQLQQYQNPRMLQDNQMDPFRSQTQALEHYMDLENEISNLDLEQLINEQVEFEPSSPLFISRFILTSILKILIDPSLKNIHNSSIDTLINVLSTSQEKMRHFTHLLMPVICKLVLTEELRTKILILLEKVVKWCGQDLGYENVEKVLKIFMKLSDED